MGFAPTGHCKSQQLDGHGQVGMPPDSFLSELRTLRTAYHWYLTKSGSIRATCAGEAGSHVFDPVTAVAFARTGELFPKGTRFRAAATLGMSLEDCADLTSACAFKWDPSSRQGRIRTEILNALGIVHEKEAASGREPSLLQLFARAYRRKSARGTSA
jgi:hypothetical protein